MIDAVAEAQETLPDLRLLVVGDGPMRATLEAQAAARGLTRNIEFAGSEVFTRLPDRYRSAKAFIMTSKGEGLPMAMIEALSCGLPAIVADDADILEVARPGENALVAQAAMDATEFAELIVALLDDPDLLERLRAGCQHFRREYQDEYSLPRQATLWQKTLRELP